MPTDCSADRFELARVEGRAVVAGFDGGTITSDAGALLLGGTDRAIGLVRRFAARFVDYREAEQVEHSLATLVSQPVFALALGYEDLVDHDTLRHDPVLAAVAGKLTARRADYAPLAGKSTLNRLEHAPRGEPTRYHKIGHDGALIERLFVELFLDAHKTPPEEIVLDLDATDDPLHGQQEGRFFHGYYGCYCYLPLYVFCGDHLLVAKLRRSSIDASAGAVAEIEQIVAQIRTRWPLRGRHGGLDPCGTGSTAPRSMVRIIVRADSGFARDELMVPPIAARSAPAESEPQSGWCEVNRVDYVLGLARNPRLVSAIAAELAMAGAEAERTGEPARQPWRRRCGDHSLGGQAGATMSPKRSRAGTAAMFMGSVVPATHGMHDLGSADSDVEEHVVALLHQVVDVPPDADLTGRGGPDAPDDRPEVRRGLTAGACDRGYCIHRPSLKLPTTPAVCIDRGGQSRTQVSIRCHRKRSLVAILAEVRPRLLPAVRLPAQLQATRGLLSF